MDETTRLRLRLEAAGWIGAEAPIREHGATCSTRRVGRSYGAPKLSGAYAGWVVRGLGSTGNGASYRPVVTDLFAEPEPAAPATPLPRVEIYTDGACKRNPDGPGGWGVVLSSGRHRKELHGGSPSTTNNRMELTAVIEALNALRGPERGRVVHRQRVRPQRHYRVDPQLEEARLEDC
jgi:hypothetical protein